MIASRNTRRFRLSSLAILVFAVLVSLYPLVRLQLRAASLLLRIQNPQAQNVLARFATYPVDEFPTTVASPSGPVRAKLYSPRNLMNPSAMVVLHGIQHLGIDEPRLVNFSRAMAASGIEVLTPELQSLADYRVDPRDIPVIGASAQALRRRAGAKPGVLGLSFSGGLALLTAASPTYAEDIGFVVAVGAYDDLERVARYLATSRISRPDGTIQSLPANEYGTLVLVNAHSEDFFAPADADIARDILRLELWQDKEASRARAAQLSPAGRVTMQHLLDHKDGEITQTILAHLPRHALEMASVSPHGHMASLHVPVLLLHGSGDNVIPAAETLWLAQDVPSRFQRKVLITPFLTHVQAGGKTSWHDKAELIEFVVAMLEESDRQRARP